MKLPGRLLIIVVIQTLVLAGMVAKRQWTLATGTPVVLETRPVDPRSLFRGDYVTFNYDIGSLNLQELDGDDDFRSHDTVYVVLESGEPYWRPRAVYHAPPADRVALRGEVQYVGEHRWNPETRSNEAVRHLSVRYGIEDYFVPEGEGRALERPQAGETVSLRVAVDRFGNGAIQALLINGVERYRETLF
jgi:uncharacterized membrane-anchored protein